MRKPKQKWQLRGNPVINRIRLLDQRLKKVKKSEKKRRFPFRKGARKLHLRVAYIVENLLFISASQALSLFKHKKIVRAVLTLLNQHKCRYKEFRNRRFIRRGQSTVFRRVAPLGGRRRFAAHIFGGLSRASLIQTRELPLVAPTNTVGGILVRYFKENFLFTYGLRNVKKNR
jgi:hypothetical protein